MTDGVRPDRVSEEFREVLAEHIPKLKDPRVGFVTVTGVEVTPDLRRAKVYYTVMGDEAQRKSTKAGLRSARGHLRAVLGSEVRLKFLPDLEFEEDQRVSNVERVAELLKQIQAEGAGEGSPPGEEPAEPEGEDASG